MAVAAESVNITNIKPAIEQLNHFAEQERRRTIRIIQHLRNDLASQHNSAELLTNRQIRDLVNHFYIEEGIQLPWEEVVYQILVRIRVAAVKAQKLPINHNHHSIFGDKDINTHQAERFATLSIDYLYQLTSCASVWNM